MNTYVLVFGGNLGPVTATFEQAIKQLEGNHVTILKKTGALKTRPELFQDQPDFINMGILIETILSPVELLELTQKIEIACGRKKRRKYGPRELDIDIVYSAQGPHTSARLVIPHRANHARWWVRKFLAELIPDKKDSFEVLFMNYDILPVKKVDDFIKKKQNNEKITMLTCYDYTMAKLLANSSIDVLLVGDSLGNVFQGQSSTLPVTVEHIVYHSRAVKQGAPDKFIVADMPFMSYQVNPEKALENAGEIMRQSGANAVKLESAHYLEAINKITDAGIPVMGHLGLTPQSIHTIGGYRVQGRDQDARRTLLSDARELQNAGVFALVLEMVPADLASEVAARLDIPVIGIGAGNGVDGQVLVVSDVLGLDIDFAPRFVRRYAEAGKLANEAFENFARDVRSGDFPDEKESFS